jgi:glutamate 5-kinase
MATKLQAADVARRAGADVIIASGRAPEVIGRAMSGEAVGTRFPALDDPLANRKRWIFAGPRPAGRLVLDAGAVRAIHDEGRSLLPAGIVAVEGVFERGDTVLLLAPDRAEVARGIARYPSADLGRIAGCQLAEISARLGYVDGPVAVHRNDLILL